jgi:cytochrome c-type protein NapB
MATGVIMASTAPAGSVQSLRGQEIQESAAAPAKVRVQEVDGGYKRAFDEQPPLVPHKVAKYEITLGKNGCMECHSEQNYKQENAPRVGDSHYVDRDGRKLSRLAGNRYFCTQCHVPQVNAPELVKNTFSGKAP